MRKASLLSPLLLSVWGSIALVGSAFWEAFKQPTVAKIAVLLIAATPGACWIQSTVG